MGKAVEDACNVPQSYDRHCAVSEEMPLVGMVGCLLLVFMFAIMVFMIVFGVLGGISYV